LPALQGLGGNAFWWDTYDEFKAVTAALNPLKTQLKNPLATVSSVGPKAVAAGLLPCPNKLVLPL